MWQGVCVPCICTYTIWTTLRLNTSEAGFKMEIKNDFIHLSLFWAIWLLIATDILTSVTYSIAILYVLCIVSTCILKGPFKRLTSLYCCNLILLYQFYGCLHVQQTKQNILGRNGQISHEQFKVYFEGFDGGLSYSVEITVHQFSHINKSFDWLAHIEIWKVIYRT